MHGAGDEKQTAVPSLASVPSCHKPAPTVRAPGPESRDAIWLTRSPTLHGMEVDVYAIGIRLLRASITHHEGQQASDPIKDRQHSVSARKEPELEPGAKFMLTRAGFTPV